MGKGSGFGKTILFGEHFVVYGLEGIACALGKVTTCEVEIIEGDSGWEWIDNRPVSQDYKIKKQEEYNDITKAILKHLNVKNKLKITLGGDLVPASGVGASGAYSASLSEAISDEYNLKLNKEQINESAYIGETAGTGVVSGLDNTTSVYGGLVILKKDLEGGPIKFENISIKAPIEIVLIDSGSASSTKEVVEAVKKLKESNPDKINPVFEEYNKLVKEAKLALADYDLEKLAELMEKNQELLRKITVSNEQLEKIIKIALDAGAKAAKLTGTGRGGSVIALTPGKELQERVASTVKGAGYEITLTTIG